MGPPIGSVRLARPGRMGSSGGPLASDCGESTRRRCGGGKEGLSRRGGGRIRCGVGGGGDTDRQMNERGRDDTKKGDGTTIPEDNAHRERGRESILECGKRATWI